MKILLLIILNLALVSCTSVCSSTNSSCTFGSVNTSSNIFDSNFQNKKYEATIIRDLSPDPILIEYIDSVLIFR